MSHDQESIVKPFPEVLRSLEVRPINRHERALWDDLMRQYHYLGLHSLVGESIRYIALHTQKETARYLVEEKGADYLMTVKDNQRTLKQDIEDLRLVDFPPSATNHR